MPTYPSNQDFRMNKTSLDETSNNVKYEIAIGEIETNGTTVLPSGLNYSDYLYWDSNTSTYLSSNGSNNVHLGGNAGLEQSSDCVAVGFNAGPNQSGGSIAIGSYCGASYQKEGSVAIGSNSANSQGNLCTAVGPYSAYLGQSDGAIAVGYGAGAYFQGSGAIAIGSLAGFGAQNPGAISIGNGAGLSGNLYEQLDFYGQGTNAIAIGFSAGGYTGYYGGGLGYTGYIQNPDAIAIGSEAGSYQQGSGAIAIGKSAGNMFQGESSIAIGQYAGFSQQVSNSIVLNATGEGLDASNSGLYISPVRDDTSVNLVLTYNSTTKEVLTNSEKTFIIDHPLIENKYLIHSCLEAPEAGVYYRGKSEIESEYVTIHLPEYCVAWNNFTIQLTLIHNIELDIQPTLSCSEVEDNKFVVYSNLPCKFFWLVHATRNEIEVEVNKDKVVIEGSGPYKYVSKNL